MACKEEIRMESAKNTGEENNSRSIENASLSNADSTSSPQNNLELERNSEKATSSSSRTASSLQNQSTLDQGELKRHFESSDDVEEKRQKVELCHEEIQTVKAPCMLKIREKTGGILVELLDQHETRASQLFPFSDEKPEESIREDVENYIINHYKNIVDDVTHELIFDIRWWPRILMDIPSIKSAHYFRVCMYKTMYDDFVAFTKANTFEEGNFDLRDCENVEERVVLGAEFFKAAFATQLIELATSTRYEIDREDFKKFQLHLKVQRWTSWLLEAIREKVEAANKDTFGQLSIDLLRRDDPRIRLKRLFPPARFQVEGCRHKFKIGEFVRGDLTSHGKSLYLDIGTELIGLGHEYYYEKSDSDEEDEEGNEGEDGGNIVN